MTAVVNVLNVIGIICSGILLGGLIIAYRLIVPTVNTLAPTPSVKVHQTMLDGQPDRFMQPMGVIGLLCIVIILILHHNLPALSVVGYAVAVVGTLMVILLSRYRNVKTNTMIRYWDPENVPANYPEIRKEWNMIHFLRIVGGTLMFLGITIAALAYVG